VATVIPDTQAEHEAGPKVATRLAGAARIRDLREVYADGRGVVCVVKRPDARHLPDDTRRARPNHRIEPRHG
jgi:hypothetical protein